MTYLLFHLDATLSASLQKQLRQQIAQAILAKHIPLDRPLPSSRKLAKELNIARNTVVLAYEHLLDDGYLLARERSGYYVNPDILQNASPQHTLPKAPRQGVNLPDWQKRFKLHPSRQENIFKPANWQDYDYPFIYGQFDPALFPTNHWRDCCKDNVSVASIRSWAADHFVDDDPLLIDQLQTRILPRRGIWANPDQILITVGAQNGLYMLAKLLLNQHTVLGIENPGYVDIHNIALLNPTQIKPLSVDEDGLIINDDINKCDCIYTTPSHQYPTTVTMSLDRRRQLLDKAQQHDLLIIEDDYECETNFNHAPSPALKSMDQNDRVIYIGSFSKTLAPGLRLGYLVASKELIQEARALRRLIMRHPPANNQRSVGLFVARGYYDSLASNLVKAYTERHKIMQEALQKWMPDAFETPTFGGSSYWIKGSPQLDANRLKRLAREHSILIEAGQLHFMDDQPPNNYFRLGYSSIAPQLITPGVAKLAELINQLT